MEEPLLLNSLRGVTLRVEGSGLGFGVEGLEFRAGGLGLGVWDLGIWVWGFRGASHHGRLRRAGLD